MSFAAGRVHLSSEGNIALQCDVKGENAIWRAFEQVVYVPSTYHVACPGNVVSKPSAIAQKENKVSKESNMSRSVSSLWICNYKWRNI